jgi:AcrR family transcriptional regulator
MAPRADSRDREQRILDAAAAVLLRLGYAKTTMSTVADEAGISRGMIYLAFATKDDLVDAVLARDIQAYIAAWRDAIATMDAGTIGGVYRAALQAIMSRPLMAALMTHDRRVLGRYVQRPASGMPALAAQSLWHTALCDLQTAGAIRADIDPTVIAYLLDLISYGLLHADTRAPDGSAPPFAQVMETIATMLDHFLIPVDGGNRAAGTVILHALARHVDTLIQRHRVPESEGAP